MEVDSTTVDISNDTQLEVLNTVEGEIQFFRALMRARPVGMNRHFHVMTMQAAIEKGVNQPIPINDIWQKLESCYNLDALENLETDLDLSGSSASTSSSAKRADSQDPFPFFRTEFSLPRDNLVESLLAERRVRSSPSPPSSPSRSPSVQRVEQPRRGRKRRASKATLGGLVSGDSDSSDLTQQSGDDPEGEEGGDPEQEQTPSEQRANSVATGTDGASEGEDDGREDDAPSRPKRGRKPGRGRGRGTRKRKR